MTDIERKETMEIIGKMIAALQKHGDAYATGYLETFITSIIEKHVTDPAVLSLLHMRMLKIGIDHLIDASKT